MNADPSQTISEIDSSEIEEFFSYLRNNQFPCGVGERVRATRVIGHFSPDRPSPRWKSLLSPIFARNPGEQERFSQAFDLFFGEDPSPEAPPPPPGKARLERPPTDRFKTTHSVASLSR